MALNAATLKGVIKPDLETKIRNLLLGGDPTAYPNLTNFCDAVAESISNAVVAHIQSNAELNNAKFSGTFAGSVSGATCSTTITNQPVTGGIR